MFNVYMYNICRVWLLDIRISTCYTRLAPATHAWLLETPLCVRVLVCLSVCVRAFVCMYVYVPVLDAINHSNNLNPLQLIIFQSLFVYGAFY